MELKVACVESNYLGVGGGSGGSDGSGSGSCGGVVVGRDPLEEEREGREDVSFGGVGEKGV